MKKLVLFSCLLLVLATTGAAFAQTPARCTPNADTINARKIPGTNPVKYVNGFYPNPSPVFCVGTYGEAVITVIAPFDTLAFGQRIRFTKFVLDSISNVPAGLNFQTDQANNTFTPLNNTTPIFLCTTIYGTASQFKVNPLDSVVLNLKVTVDFGTGLTQSGKLKYRVRTAPAGTPGCVTTLVDADINEGNTGVYPNPVSDYSTFNYELKSRQNVRVELFDLTGRAIATLRNQSDAPGYYSLPIPASTLPAGIYMVKVSAGNTVVTRKLVKD